MLSPVIFTRSAYQKRDKATRKCHQSALLARPEISMTGYCTEKMKSYSIINDVCRHLVMTVSSLKAFVCCWLIFGQMEKPMLSILEWLGSLPLPAFFLLVICCVILLFALLVLIALSEKATKRLIRVIRVITGKQQHTSYTRCPRCHLKVYARRTI